MSFFLDNGYQYFSSKVDQSKIVLAVEQYQEISTIFNQMIKSCTLKCFPRRFEDGDLNTGEQSCIDRCILKYVNTHIITDTLLSDKQRLFNISDYMKCNKILDPVNQVLKKNE